ncbi:RNA polymerase subunit sigma-24 [Arenicella chitinivorans]|uniref:RNA polymerase subunit sigma-24 n=1 Tax=Arenicella chitinivorans TaxID=1329800 RepID=A0A918RR30_9GAMM|nr:RNA polymerase sigma factor [Arenicella chitinivorans]GHA08915.1 RNA polymerase subunit sigma-24 [Arenicella chitinivorans]
MLSDDTLVARTLSEGNHHFGALVKRYADYLFGYGLRLTGGNASLAEDLSQQTFLRAFKYLPSYDKQHRLRHQNNEYRFRNWLTGIATNCFRDLIGIEQRYQPLAHAAEPIFDPSYRDSHAFFSLIKPLGAEDRVLFVLRYVYEFSIDEISEHTGVNSGTVKSRLSRAMRKLRDTHHD